VRRRSRPAERLGDQATWVDVDRELEVRRRLACVIDELDNGDADTAALNLRWLLEDLDEATA
jgi:hypothetical protein